MLEYEKKKILEKFIKLSKCDVPFLVEKLNEKNVLPQEIIDIFTTGFTSRNICKFFLQIQDLDIYDQLIECLYRIGEIPLADSLQFKSYKTEHRTTCFKSPKRIYALEVPRELNTSPIQPDIPLEINVIWAEKLGTTEDHFKHMLYSTKSSNRGIALIFNNYDFTKGQKPRRGATMDQENLKKLFTPLKFRIIDHINHTKEQMENEIMNFVSKDYDDDILFVIVMSHGYYIDGTTYVSGIDNQFISVDWILNRFNKNDCKAFAGKPKIFIFQVCRDNDSMPAFLELDDDISVSEKLLDDMLICYACYKGHRCYRDINMGSWFIMAICDIFPKLAYKYDVEHLMKYVDSKISKFHTTDDNEICNQTITFINRNFGICYLNPGL